MLSRVNTWLTKQAALFAAAQYGESAVDVLTLVAAYEEVFLVGLASKQAILSELEVRQEEVEAERQVVQAALDKVTGEGAEYHNQLLLSQERFEKLPTLERIETVRRGASTPCSSASVALLADLPAPLCFHAHHTVAHCSDCSV